MKHCTLLAFLSFAAIALPAQADWFGSGENQFEIPFVTVGNAGNASDTTGVPNPAGMVAYEYRIGKYEVPEEAIHKANTLSDLAGDPLGLTLDERGPQKPATGLSWFEAAQFVNWLNEEKGATPAYKFDTNGDFQLWEPTDAGYNANNRFRNSQAQYFLPSVDEWYKAAYYDPSNDDYVDYPTGSNTAPTPVEFGTDPGTAVWNQTIGPADVQLAGGESLYGTVAQGGNVSEWQEGPFSGILNSLPDPDVRARRGDESGLAINGTGMSSLAGGDRLATFQGLTNGFRIASVPEPTSITIVGMIISASLMLCRPLRHNS